MNWREVLSWEIKNINYSPSFKILIPLLDKLVERNSDWEAEILDKQSLSDLGWGIQSDILYALGIKLNPEDIIKSFNKDTGEIRLEQSDKYGIFEGIWLGLEGGVDTAIIGVQLGNGFCYIAEGSPGRPTMVEYKGNNKEKAVEALRGKIESVQ